MGPEDGELTNGVIMSFNRAEPRLRVSRVEMPDGGALENEINLVCGSLRLEGGGKCRNERAQRTSNIRQIPTAVCLI